MSEVCHLGRNSSVLYIAIVATLLALPQKLFQPWKQSVEVGQFGSVFANPTFKGELGQKYLKFWPSIRISYGTWSQPAGFLTAAAGGRRVVWLPFGSTAKMKNH